MHEISEGYLLSKEQLSRWNWKWQRSEADFNGSRFGDSTPMERRPPGGMGEGGYFDFSYSFFKYPSPFAHAAGPSALHWGRVLIALRSIKINHSYRVVFREFTFLRGVFALIFFKIEVADFKIAAYLEGMKDWQSLRGLNLYARICVGSVIFLIVLGAIVTSKGAGLTVPDWPQSYGYNMFLFPYERWVGGVFWEHSHRLVASGIGLMTVILAVWIWRVDDRGWMKGVGIFAVLLVIFQGILGGVRVVWLKDELGLVHGCTAQLFLAIIGSIALFTSKIWLERERCEALSKGAVRFAGLVTLLVFLQLTMGATMRHAHRGLSIPDFPKAYGQWWPKITPEQLAAINQERIFTGHPETTLMLIHLQMGHRILAYLLTILILTITVRWGRDLRLPGSLRGMVWLWGGGLLIQVALGILTIWTDRGFEVTSAHVAMGAWTLLLGVLIVIYSGALAGMWGGEMERRRL